MRRMPRAKVTRERLAVACMVAGVPATAAGVSLFAGIGAGLTVLGVLLVALAVLLGWH